ncbi:7TM GPCR protein, partial [Aphelenchoides avenae]
MDYNLTSDDYISVSGFQARMHINTGMSIAANALVIYLILRHSTESMRSYRWCLLDMNMCYLLFDLHMTVVYEPLPIYKILGMCSVGLGRVLPAFSGTVLQVVITTLLIGFCIGAIFTAFLFRLLAVFNRMSLIKNPFVILSLVLIHLLATAPVAYGFLEPYLNGDMTVLTLTLESSPHQSAEYPCFVGNREHVPMFLGFAMIGEVVLWMPLLFAVPTITFRRLKKEQSRMTARAYRVQKKLLVSLIVQ